MDAQAHRAAGPQATTSGLAPGMERGEKGCAGRADIAALIPAAIDFLRPDFPCLGGLLTLQRNGITIHHDLPDSHHDQY